MSDLKHMRSKRKELLVWSSSFFTGITLLCILLGIRYLALYAIPKQGVALFYTVAAFVSHFAVIGYLPWLLVIVPLLLAFPVRPLVIGLSVILASCVLSILLLDSLVFAENRFHVTLLTIKILGAKTWGFGILYFFIFIAFASFAAQWVWNTFVVSRKRLPGISIGVCVVLLLLSTHAIHAWADAHYNTAVTRFTPYLPLFYPTTAKRFLESKGFVVLKNSREEQLMRTASPQNAGDFIYPAHQLGFSSPQQTYNVLFVIIDDMRNDMVDQRITSRIFHYAKNGITFHNHLSAGNSTRMGMFSLFYGIPSTYWQYIEGTRRPPVLMDQFTERHYQTGIFSSASLYFPASLDRTLFSRVSNLRGDTRIAHDVPYARDSAITREWLDWVNTRDMARPFFGFLFYDAPCIQSFPESYEQAVVLPPGATDQQRRFARYQTAVSYVDSLIGIVLDDLQKRKLLDQTVVVITADHGEEFDESGLGYKGHGTAYSMYQMQVPLVILWPEKNAGQVFKRTSHNDIPATLMTHVFGCTSPGADYCSGNDLFSEKEWDWLIVGSYYNFAIVEPGQVTVQYPGGYFEVRDREYRIMEKPALHASVLTPAFREIGRFFKRK